jgi:hypothetical protein
MARPALLKQQKECRVARLANPHARLPKGLKLMFWQITGKFQDIQRLLAQEAARARERARTENKV